MHAGMAGAAPSTALAEAACVGKYSAWLGYWRPEFDSMTVDELMLQVRRADLRERGSGRT